MNRRTFIIRASVASLAGLGWSTLHGDASAQASIPFDPEAPTGGNVKGDLTITAFVDYNCPYCKLSAPALEKIVKTDGMIRLVYKDWPILMETSVYGAQLALGAKYQGRYEVAHKALMGIPGHGVSKEKMLAAVKTTGIDFARLQSDIGSHGAEIMALLRRNLAQAKSLNLQGTPTYIIGPFVQSTLDYDGFRQVVSDARARLTR